MSINLKYQLLPAAMIMLLTLSCQKELVKTKVTIMEPVYGLKEDVYKDIKSQDPRDVEKPGKMFVLGQYVYLTEVGKGIHIIDQSNPDNLVNISFIPIPGNQDVAVKGNYLYADCATDMLVLDISNPTNVVFTKNLTDVFPDKYYQNGYYCDNQHVIVDWKAKDTMVALRPGQNPGVLFANWQNADAFNSTAGQPGFAAPSGIGGSTARFGVAGDFMYTVTSQSLSAIDVHNPASPVVTSTNSIGWDIETIYPYRNHLFIGSRNGVYIYNIDNPTQPVETSYFQHSNVCDPAIADDNHAYITLRNGTECEGFINELNVINVTNIAQPQLEQVVALTNPRGLSKDGNLLFICDGHAGLRILNASVPSQTTVEQTFPLASLTNEVIAINNIAYVIAENGLYLFDYSNYPSVVQKGKMNFKS